MVKRYEWIDAELEKKYKTYNSIMLIFGAIALACLFALPENLKIWNVVPLGMAVWMWVLSWRAHSKDAELKKEKIKKEWPAED